MKEMVQLDRKKGEVYYNGISMFVWRRDGAHRIQSEFEKIIGPAAGGIIANATNRVMKDFFVSVAGRNPKLSGVELAVKLLAELPKLGYGVPEMVFLDERNHASRVKVHNCFNTAGFGRTENPVCYRMVGILASLFELVFERKVQCREIKCRATGDKHCEFEVSSLGMPFKVKSRKMLPPKGLEKIFYKFNPDKGEITHKRVNCVFMPRRDLRVLEDESFRIIGPATATIFYNIGKGGALEAIGQNMMKSIVLMFIRRFMLEKAFKRLSDLSSEFGFGKITPFYMDIRQKTAIFRIENSAEMEGHGKGKKPACNLIAGYIAGAADVMFGKPMMCEEVRCKALGDKHCEVYMHRDV